MEKTGETPPRLIEARDAFGDRVAFDPLSVQQAMWEGNWLRLFSRNEYAPIIVLDAEEGKRVWPLVVRD